MPGLRRRSRARIAPHRGSQKMRALQHTGLLVALCLGCHFLLLETETSLSFAGFDGSTFTSSGLERMLNASLERSGNRSTTRSGDLLHAENPSYSASQSKESAVNRALQESLPLVHKPNRDQSAQQSTSDSARVVSSSSSSRPSSSTLVIASAPRNERYAVALWSQLECLADPHKYDTIVVAAPTWAHALVQPILQQARERIPHFRDVDNNNKKITSVLAHNDRYDVGLWCDALQTIRTVRNAPQDDTYVLSNDSIFALRPFTDILDTLVQRNLTMTSLNYSNRGGSYWLESVLRGFSDRGLQRFLDHSCVPKTHPFYCPHLKARKHKKRCIVEHFEIEIASLFERQEIEGLYPSDTASEGIRGRKTWVAHPGYWRTVLRQQHNFPAAKTKNPNMIPDVWSSEDLKPCTRYLDPALVQQQLEYPRNEGALEDMQQRRKRERIFRQYQKRHPQQPQRQWQRRQQ